MSCNKAEACTDTLVATRKYTLRHTTLETDSISYCFESSVDNGGVIFFYRTY